MALLPLVLALLVPQERGTPDTVEPSIQAPQKTRVLVLGTPHLETVAGFRPELLDGLLDVLEGWNPAAICVEALPGRTIATMLENEETYEPVLTQFAGGAAERARTAREHLGLNRSQAEETLARVVSGEEDLSGFETALLFLATFDTSSATLAWARETAAGEAPPETLPASLSGFLERRSSSSNEIVSLAAALALRLDLPRLEPVDDHLDKDEFLRIAPELSRELTGNAELERAIQAEVFTRAAENLSGCVAAGDLLPHYFLLNGAEYGQADVRAQWEVFLRTRLESGLDRTRLALWDVRNLNIASNIRRVTARLPGERVLVLIGAGHKPFLDALLATMLDVEVVQLSELRD